MLIKFLPHGCGDAGRAAAYVLDEFDHLNEARAGVKVLRGNLQQFASVANNLPFRQRYTSGVIAWALDDAPTDEEIQQVIDDFERVAFAGFEPDEYHFNVVVHIEPDGSTHLHILIPRLNLRSGKSLNIAPPGWENIFYSWRNVWNNEKGWARPDDPLRARTYQPGYHAYIDAASVRAALEVEPDTRVVFTAFIEGQVKQGLVKDRQDVLKTLEQFGDMSRNKNEKFIRIKPPGFDKGVRLKGVFFEEKFNATEWLADQEQLKAGQSRYSSREVITHAHQERAAQARIALAEAVEKRTTYNHERYHRQKSGGDPARQDAGGQSTQSGGVELIEITPTHIPSIADLYQSHLEKNIGVNHDRTGTAADPATRPIREAIRKASERLSKYIAAFRAAIEQSERISEQYDREFQRNEKRKRELAAAADAVEQESSRVAAGIEQLAKRNRDELVRFKEDINLLEFAMSYGYQYQRSESTKNSAVLRKGDETLVVVTNDQSYGQYFSLKNQKDCGSIIDFVQNREVINLGKVRKELRPWLPSPFPSLEPSLVPTKKAKRKPASQFQIERMLEWHRLTPYRGDFLQKNFNLSRETIQLFAEKIRLNEDGFPCFRHVDLDGITGFEIENSLGCDFSISGKPALFVHRISDRIDRIVIVSSAAEAMAYHQLKGQTNTMYFGLGNVFSESQLELLSGALNQEDRRSIPVVNALPARSNAFEFEMLLEGLVPRIRKEPPRGKTWSEELSLAQIRSVAKTDLVNMNPPSPSQGNDDGGNDFN